MNETQLNVLTANAEDDKVVKALKKLTLDCGGNAVMPTLNGAPIHFWLSASGEGFEVRQLKNCVMTWSELSVIVKEAISRGGKMYRGDRYIQTKGIKLGSPELPIDSVEGIIANKFYGAKIGEAVTRRSTYYTVILAWAKIITIHRSQGNGSFITVNQEYLN